MPIIFRTNTIAEADLRIAEVQDKYAADILVFRTDQPEAAEKDFFWHFSATPEAAALRIFEVAQEDADLTVFYTTEQEAGWRNLEKKALLK
jgi:hypothetical protein